MGPDGQYIRDAQGRPIPYRQPIGGYEEVASDDEDHTADIEREQLLAQQYAQRQQASRHASPGQASLPASSRSPAHPYTSAYVAATTPQTQQMPIHSEESPADSHHTTSSTISPITPQQAVMSGRLTSPMPDPADYEGAGYGEPEPIYPPPTTAPGGTTSLSTAPTGSPYAPRHHVPTRLSDIVEERTEPSRSSAISATPTTNSDTQGGVLGTRR